MELTKDIGDSEVEEIIITASGGPFLNTPINKFKNVKSQRSYQSSKLENGKKNFN